MAQIKDFLLDFNPWWKGQWSVEFKDRDVYRDILKFMPTPQIIALTGLRRVGKTTLMLKIADDIIKAGFEARNILYFSFDEFGDAKLKDVMKEYEAFVERDLRTGRYLLLLDEVQKLENWENQLKTVYDTFGKGMKIIVSGSESLFIRKRSKETLAGRIFEFKVEPLTFGEFLRFKDVRIEPVSVFEKEAMRLLDEFVVTQGFPELVNVTEREVIRKYLSESILEKVIYRDIAPLFKVKDLSAIRALVNLLTEEPGQLMDISALSRDLGISRQTVSNYLAYLEQSFLVRKLYNYSRNKRKTERKLKKYYPTIISADLAFREDDFSRSKVFEWLVISQIKPEFFWRDPYKNEVDAILVNKKVVPVEIKYGKISLDGLLAFMGKFDVREGCIVSTDKEEVRKIGGRKIFITPAFKFFLSKHPLLN
ncbi:ATP-binding protein [Candidatus Woesearchaeota archaeon]|nr:ATP-binding protein [Candidatus Woesearchaeota archaeon]